MSTVEHAHASVERPSAATGQDLAASARSRTFSWQDPAATAEAGMKLAGLDYIRAIVDGTLPPPPIAVLHGFEIVEAEEGRAVFALTPAEWMYNPIGMVHGGIAATILDSCMGCAVHTTLPASVGYRRPTCRSATSARWAPTPGACSPKGASCTVGGARRRPRGACSRRTAKSWSRTARPAAWSSPRRAVSRPAIAAAGRPAC